MVPAQRAPGENFQCNLQLVDRVRAIAGEKGLESK
jgi:hypothetical protein